MKAVTRLADQEVPDSIANAISAAQPKQSLGKSKNLGFFFIIGVVGLGLSISGVSAIVREGFDGWALGRALVGLLALAISASTFLAAKRSRFGELELVAETFYVRSDGFGTVELFCWGLCHDVQFVEVTRKGLYQATKMVCSFGSGAASGKLEFFEHLDSMHRNLPQEHERFAAILARIDRARAAFRAGHYHELPGAQAFAPLIDN
ncbi:MAG: hypothetical protein JJ863_10295 [Deltaproteobacteria bacterium]|nr:hypothetical protein [Deltaproteobacteria bacterium]